MIEGIYVSGQEDLSILLDLRKEIFQKEMGILPGLEQDGCDAFAVHAVACENGQPAAAGRILYDGEVFRISRVCVKREFRGKGLGDFVTRMLINRALISGAGEIYLNTFEEAKGFFEKIGFETCGPVYENGGRNCISMWLRSENLHTCCKMTGK